jgi:hypothetical protein
VGAALSARDELRAMLPRLDAAVAAGAVSTEFLLELRALAVKHAESLRQAQKAPEGSRRTRRNDAVWRSGGLWAVSDRITCRNQRYGVRNRDKSDFQRVDRGKTTRKNKTSASYRVAFAKLVNLAHAIH